jgi:hypothetical protein
MSYTQYSQYGGNPYSNGPDAEAGQGGAVSSSPLSRCATEDIARKIADI